MKNVVIGQPGAPAVAHGSIAVTEGGPTPRHDVITFPHFGIAAPTGVDHSFTIAQPAAMKLPDDLSITVSRTGDKPAQIKVKKGDKTWEVTDKEINKLPEDVRMYLNGPAILGNSLGNNLMQFKMQGFPYPMTASDGSTIQPFTHRVQVPLKLHLEW